MNLRQYKKACKKAVPYLLLMNFSEVDLVRVGVGDGFIDGSSWVSRWVERKCWDRWQYDKPNKYGYFCGLKGTYALGWTSGYESPEWEDHPALDFLIARLFDYYEVVTDKTDERDWPITYMRPEWRRPKNFREVLRLANIAKREI
jgi:hypothetical protein